jgi:hypothetical protein
MRFWPILPTLLLLLALEGPAPAGDYPNYMEDVLIHSGNESTKIQIQGMQNQINTANHYYHTPSASDRQPNAENTRRKVAAWNYTFSPSLEQQYIHRTAVMFAPQLPHASVAAVEQQLTALAHSYRAQHQDSTFAHSDGPYSIEGAIAYHTEQSAIALGDHPLPSDDDRVALATEIILKRTPAALASASNAEKQKLYEYAVIWGGLTQHDLASHSLSPARSCSNKRQMLLSAIPSAYSPAAGQRFMP